MNVTLRAIEAILEHDRTAKFYRVHLNDDELGDLKAGALLAVEGELPNWVQDWMLEVEPGTKTAVSVA